jgi:hypothetical protein
VSCIIKKEESPIVVPLLVSEDEGTKSEERSLLPSLRYPTSGHSSSRASSWLSSYHTHSPALRYSPVLPSDPSKIANSPWGTHRLGTRLSPRSNYQLHPRPLVQKFTDAYQSYQLHSTQSIPVRQLDQAAGVRCQKLNCNATEHTHIPGVRCQKLKRTDIRLAGSMYRVTNNHT